MKSSPVAGAALLLFACDRRVSSNPEVPSQPNGVPASCPVEEVLLPEAETPWSTTLDGVECQHPAVEASCIGDWCTIPAGCFVMGSPEDEYYRGQSSEQETLVVLTHDFLILRTEVTQELWGRYVRADPSGNTQIDFADPEHIMTECVAPDCPVSSVSWFDALTFTNLLSESEDLPPCYDLSACEGAAGNRHDEPLHCESVESTFPSLYECPGYRLPSEAEFEYAQRAGTRTAYYSGNVPEVFEGDPFTCHTCIPFLDQISWHCGNAEGMTHPVAQLRPNAWGLFDMHGNVTEWVNDESISSPGPSPWTDPNPSLNTGPNPIRRKLKGGQFTNSLISHRAASSISTPWDAHTIGRGFRIVRTVL